MSILRQEAAILLLAVQFLTRLPVNSDSLWSAEREAAIPRYLPLVGAALGVLLAGLLWLLSAALPQSVAALLVVSAGLLITGAFHEDGLADTFDGIGGGTDRAQALAIMRDSRLGTYGTLALIVVFALKVAVLSALPLGLACALLITTQALSRLSAVGVMATSHYVRDHGTGKPTAAGISTRSLLFASLCTGATLLVLAPWGKAATAVLLGTAFGHLAMRALFERKLGGYTGDTLGAVQQASEITALVLALAWH
ncbi:MAG: adenosylcobinamide-GDP ribazoletransferase [Pseudomonadota bacterium]